MLSSRVQSLLRFRQDPRPGRGRFFRDQRRPGVFDKSCTTEGPYESIYLYTDVDYEAVLEQREVTIDQDYFFLISYNQKLVELDRHKIRLEYERTEVGAADKAANLVG